MKKTYMPFWALLCALCASPSFASGDEAQPASRPVSPTAMHKTTNEEPVAPLPTLQIVSAASLQHPKPLNLLDLPNEILLHILSFLKNVKDSEIDLICKSIYELKNEREFKFDLSTPRNIFIHNKERFQEFCGFTFSAASGEDKPLFPFPIKTINGRPLSQMIAQNVLPYEFWSLVLNGESSKDLKELKVFCGRLAFLFSPKKSDYELDNNPLGSQGLLLNVTPNTSQPLGCILPLIRGLTGLQTLSIGQRPLATVGQTIDITALFGPSITEFSKALVGLRELEVLDIENAQFIQIKSGEEAFIFAQAFSSMSKLTKLSLMEGSLGDEGMCALAPVLKGLVHLKELRLWDMKIGVAGVKALIKQEGLVERLENLAVWVPNLKSNPELTEALKPIHEIFDQGGLLTPRVIPTLQETQDHPEERYPADLVNRLADFCTIL